MKCSIARRPLWRSKDPSMSWIFILGKVAMFIYYQTRTHSSDEGTSEGSVNICQVLETPDFHVPSRHGP